MHGYSKPTLAETALQASAFVLAVLNMSCQAEDHGPDRHDGGAAPPCSAAPCREQRRTRPGYYLGLDWFLINLRCSAFSSSRSSACSACARSSRSSARMAPGGRPVLFLINSLLVQSLTFLSLTPATEIVAHTHGSTCAPPWRRQPIWLQVIEIMVLTDSPNTGCIASSTASPSCGASIAVHQFQRRRMDWLAGSRMHVVEIVACAVSR